MLVLGYIGEGAHDSLIVKLARAVTRWVQKGSVYSNVTHVESLLAGTCSNARIGSSSLRDKGVRVKNNVELNKNHWIVLDVPLFSAEHAETWHTINNGKVYDLAGAISTILWLLKQEPEEFICVEAVAIPQGIIDSHQMTTAEFMALCHSLPGSRVVTKEFFSKG